MKKFFALSAIVLLISFISCTPENKNNGENGGNQNNPEELTTTGDALDVTNNSVTLTGYAYFTSGLGNAEVGIMYDRDQAFENAQKLVAAGLDGNNMFSVKATGLSASTIYYYKSYVRNGTNLRCGAVKSFTTKESICPEGAIDLGIVMTRQNGTTYKLYWAESNLCESGLCTNPEDYGDHYAWGETEPKSICNWITYKWCDRSVDILTKYNTSSLFGNVDDKTELDLEDDVAHVKIKIAGNWRMPSEKEWTELIERCTWTWTENYNGTDVAGRIVSSNVEGYKDKSIFLPAAGFRGDPDIYGAGAGGHYWSSSLGSGYPGSAWIVDFGSSGVYKSSLDRCKGFSVRPVSE